MTAPYRVLVTGSRDWNDQAMLAYRLGLWVGRGLLTSRPVVVVHGACPSGADRMADTIARAHEGIGIETHPADWDRYGRAAGFRRNAEMVALGADVCLCFAMPCANSRCHRPATHDSHGASHCADLAEQAGIPVRRFEDWTTAREGGA